MRTQRQPARDGDRRGRPAGDGRHGRPTRADAPRRDAPHRLGVGAPHRASPARAGRGDADRRGARRGRGLLSRGAARASSRSWARRSAPRCLARSRRRRSSIGWSGSTSTSRPSSSSSSGSSGSSPRRRPEPTRPARAVARILNRSLGNQQLGLLMAFLARKVLGQYDVSLLAASPSARGRLNFVEPNIAATAAALGVPLTSSAPSSRSTRRPTPSSSRRIRGCATTSRARLERRSSCSPPTPAGWASGCAARSEGEAATGWSE